MTQATAKVKAPRSSKQSKRKLATVMRELEKSTKVTDASKMAAGTCARIYCTW